jgi:hypothetical protein|tara:strand:+ start:784 stop:1014 length:231 start_codon:yes stop_codon:yes gene_type:complete
MSDQHCVACQGTNTLKDKVCELSDTIFFKVVEQLNLQNDLIVEHKTHTENTEKGTELFYLIEDSITNYLKYGKEEV